MHFSGFVLSIYISNNTTKNKSIYNFWISKISAKDIPRENLDKLLEDFLTEFLK